MELEHLPIIDWNQSMKLAGHKPDLAKDMLTLLISQLPNDIIRINTALQENNLNELLREVHKLHGAICYVGLPRLKLLLSTLETHIKMCIINEISALVTQLSHETEILVTSFKDQSSDKHK